MDHHFYKKKKKKKKKKKNNNFQTHTISEMSNKINNSL